MWLFKTKQKIKYDLKTAQVIKDVVCKIDPMGLLKAGCPDDEYDPEANAIAKLLKQKGEISCFDVQKVFAEWFDEKLPKHLCKKIANEIAKQNQNIVDHTNKA